MLKLNSGNTKTLPKNFTQKILLKKPIKATSDQTELPKIPESTKISHKRVHSDIIFYSPDALKKDYLKNSDSSYNRVEKTTIVKQTLHRRIRSDTLKKKTIFMSINHQETEEQIRNKLRLQVQNSFNLSIPVLTTSLFYKTCELIGKGAFGNVYLGIHRLSGIKVALKHIQKSFIQDDKTRKRVFQEVFIMNQVHHRHVLRLFELFETSKMLIIVTEYSAKGDLLKYLKGKGRLCEDEGKLMFLQIVEGVKACHSQSIIHRDIKPDNILINEDGDLKICDFGISRIAKKGLKLSEKCGTLAYIAPEIINDSAYEPFLVDV